MRHLRGRRLLTRTEERRLGRRALAGDPTAQRELIEGNLRLVMRLANELRRPGVSFEDLVQEGNVGLIRAAARYDPRRRVRFGTYAGFWIRAMMLRYLLETARMVKVGTTQAQRRIFYNLRRAQAQLAAEGLEANDAALARVLGVDERDIVETVPRLRAEESLDAPVPVGPGARVEWVRAASELAPDVVVEHAERDALLRQEAAAFAGTLTGRDAQLFRARWMTDEPQTLAAFGEGQGISRERTRQLENRLLERLRRQLEGRGIGREAAL